jgi:hypothetical protein
MMKMEGLEHKTKIKGGGRVRPPHTREGLKTDDRRLTTDYV